MNNSPKKVLIIGAGLSGLSVAYHLEKNGFSNYELYESEDRPGGLARTDWVDKFAFDHGPHFIFLKDPCVRNLILNDLSQGNLRQFLREAYCYISAGLYTRFPYQSNNYGLPLPIIFHNLSTLITERCLRYFKPKPKNLEEWIYREFGQGVADRCLAPYSRHLWAWDLKQMSCEWTKGRFPSPALKDMFVGALWPSEKRHGPTGTFWYPLKGGIEYLAKALAQTIPSQKIFLKAPVIQIDLENHHVLLNDGSRVRYDRLVSTVPLPRLVLTLIHQAPATIRQSAEALKANTIHIVNMGLKGAPRGLAAKAHWIYFSDSRILPHRISFPSNLSQTMAPEGCSSIQAEISESVMHPVDRSRLVEDTLTSLVRCGILSEGESKPVEAGGRILLSKTAIIDPGYVIYDHEHKINTDRLKDYLRTKDIESVGRFGQWAYLNMDDVILSGKTVADAVLEHPTVC